MMFEDHDKPSLACQPCSEKLPMVLSSTDIKPIIQVPASISQYLLNYQRNGVRFLYGRFKDAEGGILADDMGLGKTIQTIAFIAAILQMKGTKEDKLRHCSQYIRNDIAPGVDVPSVNPVLIICPASLTDNWIDELETWGYFKVLKIATTNRSQCINTAKHKECDVIIATFETARSCIELLDSVDWTCVIVDEVHRIKDPKSQICKALSSLQCTRRFGLTGTPFQNNTEEIFCLLSWCSPKTFPRAHSSDLSRAMEHGNKRSATKRESIDSTMARVQFRELKRKLMLRRTKEILAKFLLPKSDQVVFCELTDIQKDIYRMITESPGVQKLLGYLKAGCTKNNVKKKTGLIFTYLHLLQKTANHVGLLASGLSSSSKDITKELCYEALNNIAGLQNVCQKQWFDHLAKVDMSGKMVVLSQLLPAFLERGDKILVFSYSTKILDLIQKYLKKTSMKHFRFDGNTPVPDRFQLVKTFNKCPEPAIFLLSTKAGGVGLNICGANVVIIYDPSWNPAYDLQAQDRACRIGQERDVRVYRLLSTSTIEEFVYLRQVYKQQLASLTMTAQHGRRYFDSVQGDPRFYGELFGVKNLLSFRESCRCLTEELLEKQQQIEETLRLKLVAPSSENISKALTSPCVLSAVEGSAELCNEKFNSGLTQLCTDLFEFSHQDRVEKESEKYFTNDESEDDFWDEEIMGSENENVNEEVKRNESISTVLERSGVVRHVVEHRNVIAPSSVEDFIAECAIVDVMERGMNSQIPAIVCSTQDLNEEAHKDNKQDEDPPQADKCRSKFEQIAREEFLTPYDLACKVLIMSDTDKKNLLNKHQKKNEKKLSKKTNIFEQSVGTTKCSPGLSAPPTDSLDCTFRAAMKRKISEGSNEKNPDGTVPKEYSVVLKQMKTPNVLSKRSVSSIAESVKHKQEETVPQELSSTSKKLLSPTLTNPNNGDWGKLLRSQDSDSYSTSSHEETSILSDRPSSFELEASELCPNLSKEAILAMKELLSCRRSYPAVKKEKKKCHGALKGCERISKPAQSHSNVGNDKNSSCGVKEENNTKSNDCSSKSSNDGNSGCSKEALAFLDSLFSSNSRQELDKKKPHRHSAPLLFKNLSQDLPDVDNPKVESISKSTLPQGLTAGCAVSVALATAAATPAAAAADDDDDDDDSIIDISPPSPYRPEDSVLNKLLASGTLRRL